MRFFEAFTYDFSSGMYANLGTFGNWLRTKRRRSFTWRLTPRRSFQIGTAPVFASVSAPADQDVNVIKCPFVSGFAICPNRVFPVP